MSDGNRELPGWRLLDLCVTLAAWLVESLVGSLLSHGHWSVMASTAWPRFGMPPVSISRPHWMQLRPPATFPTPPLRSVGRCRRRSAAHLDCGRGRCGVSTRLCARLTLVEDAVQFDPQAIVEALTVLTAVVLTTHQI